MCGRFAASASTDTVVEVFGVGEVVDEAPVSFNLAPTDPVPAVVERVDKERGAVTRKLVAPRWGLVPAWAKDPRIGARMINARAESVAEKPAFRKAFRTRRCLIPAAGYYEWLKTTASGRAMKQPFFIHPVQEPLFVMAGLYEFWRDPAGEWLTTCTIITSEATDELGRIHDRQPMTIAPDAWSAWLDPGLTDAAAAASLLLTQGDLEARAVSTAVNSVRNDGPELIEAVPFEPPAEGRWGDA